MSPWRRRYDEDYDFADWTRDAIDIDHDYLDDWTDRWDDAEGHVRNAFSSLFGNRGSRRRPRDYRDDPYYYGDRPPRSHRRGIRAEEILEYAGFYELLDRVEELTQKVENLTRNR